MVIRLGAENGIGYTGIGIALDDDPEFSAILVVQCNPVIQCVFPAQPINDADAFSCFVIFRLIANFELVELL